jgi:hypothetical protein
MVFHGASVQLEKERVTLRLAPKSGRDFTTRSYRKFVLFGNGAVNVGIGKARAIPSRARIVPLGCLFGVGKCDTSIEAGGGCPCHFIIFIRKVFVPALDMSSLQIRIDAKLSRLYTNLNVGTVGKVAKGKKEKDSQPNFHGLFCVSHDIHIKGRCSVCPVPVSSGARQRRELFADLSKSADGGLVGSLLSLVHVWGAWIHRQKSQRLQGTWTRIHRRSVSKATMKSSEPSLRDS